MELLKQKQDQLFSMTEQVAILLAVSSGVFKTVDRPEIDDMRKKFLAFLREKATEVMGRIESTGELSEDDKAELMQIFQQYTAESGVHHAGTV